MADYRNSVGYLQLRAANQARQQAITDATTNQIGEERDVGGKALGVVQSEVQHGRNLERDASLQNLRLQAKLNTPRDELKDQLTLARIAGLENLAGHRGNMDDIAKQTLGLNREKFGDKKEEDDFKHQVEELKLLIMGKNAQTREKELPFKGTMSGMGVTVNPDTSVTLRDGQRLDPQNPVEGRLPSQVTSPADVPVARPLPAPLGLAQPQPSASPAQPTSIPFGPPVNFGAPPPPAAPTAAPPQPNRLPRVKDTQVVSPDAVKEAQKALESGVNTERMAKDSIAKLETAMKEDPNGFGLGAADVANAKIGFLGLNLKIPGANWVEDALVDSPNVSAAIGAAPGTPAYEKAKKHKEVRARLKAADEELAQFRAQAISGLTVTDQQDSRIREILGMMNGDSFRNDPKTRLKVMKDFLARVQQLNKQKQYIKEHFAIPLEDVPDSPPEIPANNDRILRDILNTSGPPRGPAGL